MNKYTHPSDIEIGDVFSEDPYPDKYKAVNTVKNGVIGKNLKTGERITFSSSTRSAYAPDIIIHKNND
mgnify:CR=1 FL=1